MQVAFLSLLFTSCSTLQEKANLNITGPWLSQAVQGICFDAEGRGRIESSFGKFVFSQESALKKQQKLFQLAINIPLVGEELLELDYGIPLEKQRFFKSSLYQNFINEARNQGHSEKEADLLLREFVAGLSRYLDLVTKIDQVKCEVRKNESCSLASNEGFSLERDELKYWRHFATNHRLQITNGDWQNGKFQRLSLVLLHSESKLFSLNLFQSQCLE